MNTKRGLMLSSLVTLSVAAVAKERPNIVVLFADDISAREFQVYGSSVWTSPLTKNTSDIDLRAKTPVMEQFDVYTTEYNGLNGTAKPKFGKKR